MDQVDAAFMAGDHNTLSSASHSPDYRTAMFSSGGMRCLLECDAFAFEKYPVAMPMLVVVTTPCNALPRWTGTLRAASFEL